MGNQRTALSSAAALGLILGLGSAGCVEPFGGANLQVSFLPGSHTPGTHTEGTVMGRPPANTYYTFYAVDVIYEEDEDGLPVLGDDGEPIALASYAYEMTRFEIKPIIDQSSPCFIDLDDARFPGVHVTRFHEKLADHLGVDMNPFVAKDAGADEGIIIDLLGAQRRTELLPRLQSGLQAVVSSSNFQYPQPGDTCVADGGPTDRLPPPRCIDDESNAVRLRLCHELWDANPSFYEGSDKVFTLPLNGDWRGVVNANNPKNNGPVGGSQFFVELATTELDGLLLNWQYKDLNGDGEPDYPAGMPDSEKSAIGYHYMSGKPVQRTREVINVPLSNQVYTQISAEAVVFPELARDRVNF